MHFRSVTHLSLLLCFNLCYSIAASDANRGVVFVTDTSGADDPFVFALNVDNDGDDFYFHMSAPSNRAWMSVGTGEEMDNSFMIVVYAGSNGKDITISPRVAMNGNAEPTYYPSITCEQLNGRGSTNSATGSSMVAQGVCRNVTAWQEGAVDLTSTEQPFMFAMAPKDSMKSDSPSAPMRKSLNSASSH